MKDHQAKDLLKKYKDGSMTALERAQLEAWYLKFAKSRNPVSVTDNELETDLNEVWSTLPVSNAADTNRFRLKRYHWWWLAGVASVLLFCAVGITYYLDNITIPQPANQVAGEGISPGDNRAVLTLDDGETILLNDAKIGTLANEGLTAITKTEEGRIAYHTQQLPGVVPVNKADEPLYNTLSTPPAGQYQVQLPDGTDVWLNAHSSIRFPSAFPEKERVVEITGEVYFEVAKVTKDAKRVPFRVLAGNQIIEVLGTRFNVNSYNDEDMIETTLLEGSIKINMGKGRKREILLKPGEQIRIAQDSPNRKDIPLDSSIIQEIDTESVVSWKEGYFSFDNMGLTELMRQISRWYDIEVVYETPVKEYEFIGKIERSAELSKILKILELGGVHFRMEGKKIIVK